ncbi:hypothetical protein ACN27G_27670 [Plantactinospora sp. WMMB334]|uniref:hypothetical protein n=1 Tax=Plantactinospora sp. WMMB334 TaxID=3404119 RepID=UPI003B925674
MTVYAFRNVDDDGSAVVWYRIGDVLCAMGEWPGGYRWADLLETDEARVDIRFRDVDPNPDDPDLPHALSTEVGLWWLASHTGLDETGRLRLAAIVATAEVCRMVPVDGDR